MKIRNLLIGTIATVGFTLLMGESLIPKRAVAEEIMTTEALLQSRADLVFNCSPGNTVEVTLTGTDFAEIKVIRSESCNIEFSATLTSSENGKRYVSADGRYVFINKGESCIVFDNDEIVVNECFIE